MRSHTDFVLRVTGSNERVSSQEVTLSELHFEKDSLWHRAQIWRGQEWKQVVI